MVKPARNNPRRQPAYKTVQFWLAFVGLWLVISGTTGAHWLGDDQPVPASTQAPPTGRLQVREATQRPASVINELQNAGGLQRQTGAGLQRPSGGDYLQPNAKTDSFNQPAGQ